MNKSNQLGSISSSDLIDAKLEEHQMCGSKQCPGCGHKLEGKPDWLGLPAGVKFDPTDQELIEHLEAKVEEARDMKSHPLIDEFITPIEGEDGICYTHPEKLPGVTRDGLNKHFFHRPSKAYTTGTRKRRKIQTECDLQGGETRWHKTGKTRPVMVNGKQKGCKKILVLYTNFGKNRKPEKTNWVMHQYHLGQFEEEKEGELVVSKIFYQTQPRQCNWTDRSQDPNVNRTDTGVSTSPTPIKTVNTQRDKDLSGPSIVASLSTYSSTMDIQPVKSDHFSFPPSFDHEVRIGEASTRRDALASGTSHEHEMHEQQQQPHHMTHEHLHQLHIPHHNPHQQQIATTSFHMSMPSPISTIIATPPLHHSSINILDHDSYQVSTIMLQNENFQQQQQHHKICGRSASSGLEELIMGCTSSTTDHVKQESSSSMTNPQVAEWLKYSSFWHDPDNPDHLG